MIAKLNESVKTTLHDPTTGKFTSYAKFIAREQRRQAVYAEACEMTPVDVTVKPVAGPVCLWSPVTDEDSKERREYVRLNQMRPTNWAMVV